MRKIRNRARRTCRSHTREELSRRPPSKAESRRLMRTILMTSAAFLLLHAAVLPAQVTDSRSQEIGAARAAKLEIIQSSTAKPEQSLLAKMGVSRLMTSL